MGPNTGLAGSVIVALLVILAATTLCGRLCRHIGQPRVVGEMIAGIMLGPTVLGALAPTAAHALFSPDVKAALNVLSTIGLTIFMFLVGAGIDHGLVNRQVVRRSLAVAVAGIVPPFALGAGLGVLFADRLTPPGGNKLVFTLFLAAALSVTAFPVLARILHERRMNDTGLGALTLLAAAADDAFAWSMLAVVVALAGAGGLTSAGLTIVATAAFAVVMLTVVRRLLAPLVSRVEARGRLNHGDIGVLLITVLASGWITEMIGVHAVFGGFLAGLAVPQSPVLREELRRRLADLAVVLLLPVFFVYSGLNTTFAGFGQQYMLLVPLVVTVVAAFVGKFAGCALTVRGLGYSWRHACAVGGLMNARGLMILIFVNVGLEHGVIGPSMFAILVMVALLTTAAALPIYRLAFPDRLEEAERDLPNNTRGGHDVQSRQSVHR